MTGPHYADDAVTVHHGDCLDVMATLPDASVDAVVTDPPYGLEFMGKEWDAPWQARTGIGEHSAGFSPGAPAVPGVRGEIKSLPSYMGSTNPTCRNCGGTRNGNDRVGRRACRCDKPTFPNTTLPRMVAFQQWCEQWTAECLRVLKPGGYLLAFGGSRTWHRLACAVEDAGFEVRDSIAWLYASGFPKSLDVSKAIDKAAGAEREVVGEGRWAAVRGTSRGASQGASNGGAQGGYNMKAAPDETAPATPDAARWQGWGTALKPAYEPVVVGRKPLVSGDILGEIGSHLDRLESEWQALAAEPTTRTGAAGGSFALTATSPSESTGATGSNTVSSWRVCWAELCSLLSTSTTATTSSTTTDLRTLSSCLGKLTAGSIRASESSPPGSTSIASAADHLFASVVCGLRATLALSVIGPATDGTLPEPRDAAGSGSAFEPVVVARKPLVGTVAGNVLAHGTGALNIDGCRVEAAPGDYDHPGNDNHTPVRALYEGGTGDNGRQRPPHAAGRWPTNVVLDGHAADELDRQSGVLTSGVLAAHHTRNPKDAGILGAYGSAEGERGYGDSGGASRFFPTFRYEAKAPTAERPRHGEVAHPTVKPLDLMRWLVRLVTPPGGTVLEPFAGSGATAEACVIEGFRCIAIEREAAYLPLIVARLSKPIQPDLFGGAA